MATDLDVLKEIPGYKAILKSVLKSQIQMLMEQLSNQTGEESIILTASVHDGSLSHLGSRTGKGFLEGRDEIKAQFLGYCLKSQHKKDSQETESPQFSRSRTLMPPARRQRPRIRPAPYSIGSPGANNIVPSSPPFQLSSQHDMNDLKASNNDSSIKNETADAADNFLDSVTSEGDAEFPAVDDSNISNNQNESFDSSQSLSQEDIGNTVQTVKIEPQTADNDLEVTGMEMGDNSLSSSDNWGQNYSSTGQNEGGQHDQNSYNGSEQTQKVGASHNFNFGGIAFPGLDNAHHDFSSRTLPEMSPADVKQALYPQGLFKNSINSGTQNEETQNNHVNVPGQFDPSPRKRGRPRKVPAIPAVNSVPRQMAESSPPSQNNQENDLPNDGLIRRRGRPRKDLDETLPPGVVRPMGISIGNGYVKCNICGKILKATSMFSHKQSHLGIRNYGCEYCGKSFTQKGPLITHKRVHTGEKPYSCQRCGKAFAAHSGLYQHSRRCARNAAMEHFNLTM